MDTLYPNLKNGYFCTPYGKKRLKDRKEVFMTVRQLCDISGIAHKTVLRHIYSGLLNPERAEGRTKYLINADTAKAYTLEVWARGKNKMHCPFDELGYEGREMFFLTRELFDMDSEYAEDEPREIKARFICLSDL